MLYGSDYRSTTEHDAARLVRRFRRDVMFVAARRQEVIAAGLIAGLVIVPLLLVVSGALAFAFSLAFSGTAGSGAVAAANGAGGLDTTPTSRSDLLLVLIAVLAVLVLAGGLSAALRRFDYNRRGGLRFFLHHPRSPLGLAGFFAPVTALTVVALLLKAAQAPRINRSTPLAATPSLFDRGVLYLFLGIVLSMLLYLVWENCFPLILPTLSDLDVDAEVARRQQADRARVGAEEDALRGRGGGFGWAVPFRDTASVPASADQRREPESAATVPANAPDQPMS